MPIQVTCPQCNALLQVNEKLAGQKGKCPKCSAVVTIPGTDHTQRPSAQRMLCDASPREMVAELFRRKKSAVLAYFDTPATNSYKLTELADLKIDCLGSEEMNVDQLRQVLDDLSTLSKPKAPGAISIDAADEEQLYELKGDQLGMSLADFQIKHSRRISGQPISLPWCSDSMPDHKIPELLVEDWHTKAGIVHGRLDLPLENNSPTIAGVKTDLLLYQFVDGQLFRITAFFDTDSFHIIRDSIIKKYGPPKSETSEPREFTWGNRRSSIKLTRGTIRPKAASLLHFMHDNLLEKANLRQPSREDDL